MNKKLENKIKQICNDDVYDFGCASLSGLLHEQWSKYNYGISIIRKLDNSIIEKIKNGPTIEYYDLYNNINAELNNTINEIVCLLHENDYEATAIKSTAENKYLDDDYKKTLRYPFSHKMVATQAGLGWIGKTDLLVSHKFGPRIRLASILTVSKIFDTGIPIYKSLCGNCNLCVKKCPAQAATGALWYSSLDRDDFYNPFKCREYARNISSKKIQKEISLCGICVSVCPEGKKNT